MKEKKKKKKESNIILYQELPSEVLDGVEIPESPSTIKEYISSALPISDSRYVTEDLKKTNISIVLEARQPKKAKPRHRKTELSQKERRSLGLYRLPKAVIKYKDAMPMNKLWEGYMVKFLNLDQLKGKSWFNPKTGNLWEAASITLLKADYHGALVKVINSKCPSFLGHEGIIIFDTKFTFSVVGKDDVTRVIPKLSCIFEITLKQYKFTIFGKYFCLRTAERSTKKIKSPFIPVL